MDKRRGALIGLAVGDALGAPVEFQTAGTFQKITGYRDGGPFNLKKGQWTDDTSMALALATSISRGWNLHDQMREYLLWWREGKHSITNDCFDIGSTTMASLRFYETKGCFSNSGSAYSNGCIMRLAPVAIRYCDLYPDNITLLAEYGDESCKTTHDSEVCRSAGRYMTVALAALMRGEDRTTVLDPDWKVLEQLDLRPQILEIAKGSYLRKTSRDIFASGLVTKSLEAALWAFHKAKSFEEAVLIAVNLGDDADTVGAICGQFAGAYWGESQIPATLIRGLDRKDMLDKALSGIII